MNAKARVLIVDDHPVVREGLALRINRQPDMAVCGEAEGRAAALQQIAACNPDLAVVDLALADGDGLDLVRDLKTRHPQLPVLVLSVRDERLYAPRALRAGAKGYIMKQEVTEKLIEAIRYILGGQVYLSDKMCSCVLDNVAAAKSASGLPLTDQLSDRELEVFRLLGEGLRTQQIATSLHVGVKTVETYYERIKVRLNAESLRELTRYATLWVDEQLRQT